MEPRLLYCTYVIKHNDQFLDVITTISLTRTYLINLDSLFEIIESRIFFFLYLESATSSTEVFTFEAPFETKTVPPPTTTTTTTKFFGTESTKKVEEHTTTNEKPLPTPKERAENDNPLSTTSSTTTTEIQTTSSASKAGPKERFWLICAATFALAKIVLL